MPSKWPLPVRRTCDGIGVEKVDLDWAAEAWRIPHKLQISPLTEQDPGTLFDAGGHLKKFEKSVRI